MMKELNLKIKTCQDCPYAIVSNMSFVCIENDDKRICTLDHYYLDKIGVPKWCPLDDAKDQGVKVGCTAILVRDGKVLLGLRGEGCETARNEWACPGGRMDYGENPITTICREVEEETDIEIQKKDVEYLCFVNEFFPEDNKHYISFVYFITNIKSDPKITEPDKCKEWKWFDPDNLPKNTLWTAMEKIEKNKDKIKNR